MLYYVPGYNFFFQNQVRVAVESIFLELNYPVLLFIFYELIIINRYNARNTMEGY